MEVPAHLLGRHRLRLHRDDLLPPRRSRAGGAQAERAVLDPARGARRAPRSDADEVRVRLHTGRLRHQGRAGADPFLAARRAQPGAGAGLGDVFRFPVEHRALLHHALRAAGAECARQRLRRAGCWFSSGRCRSWSRPGSSSFSATPNGSSPISSVEHIGIIALGFGLGPLGAFAALFHMLNHSLSKSLAFFAVGPARAALRQPRHGHLLSGALRADRLWGLALLGSILALIGAAPFAIFMSEYQLLRAAVGAGAWVVLGAVPRRRRRRLRLGVAAPDRHGVRRCQDRPRSLPLRQPASALS